MRSVQLKSGPLLHYVEQGAADGEAIIFLHGWPDSWFTFSRILSNLPPSFRAFAVDQRGFGESQRPDEGYTIPDFAADVTAFMDALSITQATLVGHSFGSFVARCAALTYPERVRRLVLIGSAVSADNPIMREVQDSLHDLTDPVSAEFARDFQASTAFAPLPESFFEQVIAESLKLPARLWRDLLESLRAYRDADHLEKIVAPVLLIWGDRDALFSREEQDHLLTAIPQATLKVYPEIGHCPNWERPEQVAADLTAFCGENRAALPSV